MGARRMGDGRPTAAHLRDSYAGRGPFVWKFPAPVADIAGMRRNMPSGPAEGRRTSISSGLLLRVVLAGLCIWIGTLVVQGVTLALMGAPVTSQQASKQEPVR